VVGIGPKVNFVGPRQRDAAQEDGKVGQKSQFIDTMLFDLDDELDPFITNFFDLMSEEDEDENLMSGKRKYSEEDDEPEELSQGYHAVDPVRYPQDLLSTKRMTNSVKCSQQKAVKIGYSGTTLTRELSHLIKNDPLAVHATKALGELIYLHKSDDSMRFIYGFHLPSSSPYRQVYPHSVTIPTAFDVATPTLTLTIIRGSIFTTLFSAIARFDDEYLLELKGINTSQGERGNFTTESESETTLLWSMRGYLHQNNHQQVESSELDWNKMKQLQDLLQMNEIGVHSFAMILSRYVLCLPLHEREGQHYDPMPAAVM
jgi:hypothetical protein